MKPENKDQLAKVLGYHVLFGRLTTKDLTAEKSAATATIGQPIILEKKGGAPSWQTTPGSRSPISPPITASFRSSTRS